MKLLVTLLVVLELELEPEELVVVVVADWDEIKLITADTRPDIKLMNVAELAAIVEIAKFFTPIIDMMEFIEIVNAVDFWIISDPSVCRFDSSPSVINVPSANFMAVSVKPKDVS